MRKWLKPGILSAIIPPLAVIVRYKANTVSQISGKILCMRKWLKPGILSAIIPPLAVIVRYKARVMVR